MNRPPEALLVAAENSALTATIPRHLIRPYLEILWAPPYQRERDLSEVASWLNKRSSIASTISSGASSNRSTQYSLASTNTSYSGQSIDGRPHNSVGALEIPYSVSQTPRIDEEEVGTLEFPSNLNVNKSPKLKAPLSPTLGGTSHPTPASVPEIPFYCPWCGKSNARSHELKKHIESFCCSRTVHVCLKCGFLARTKLQRQKHQVQDGSEECKTYGFGERVLDFDRQAFGCGGCGECFHSLERYRKHITKRKGSNGACRPGPFMTRQERIRQIRALLQQDQLKDRARLVRDIKWPSLPSINSLQWDLPIEKLTEVVERLEYGPLEVEEGQLNCGIPKDEVVDFLDWLIGNANLRTLEKEHSIRAGNGQSTVLPSSSSLSTMAISGRISDMNEPNFLTTSSAEAAHEDNIRRTSHNDPHKLFPPTIAHRPKRPISEGSAQHPESSLRSRPSPFPEQAAAQSNVNYQMHKAGNAFSKANQSHGNHAALHQSSSNLQHFDFSAMDMDTGSSDLADMLDSFPNVPNFGRSSLDRAFHVEGLGVDHQLSGMHGSAGLSESYCKPTETEENPIIPGPLWRHLDDDILSDFTTGDFSFFSTLDGS